MIDVESLFRRYGPMVHRRCVRLLGRGRDAEDAMQDVFVRLVSRRDTLHAGRRVGQRAGHAGEGDGRRSDENDGQVAALLWTMATQVSLNRLRTRRRKPEHGAELLDAIAAADDPEERVFLRRALDVIFVGDHGRRVSTRTLAVLRYVDGMSLDETAAATGLSVAGVRKRLDRLKRDVAALGALKESAS
jgi:RNA polymerase sigma-70 factor (ECF subfamily)